MTDPTPEPSDQPRQPEVTTTRPRIASDRLLQGAQAVEIEHAGQCYLLRVTRENKLILTK